MNKSLVVGWVTLLLSFFIQSSAFAREIISIDNDNVIVCPAKPQQKVQPKFNEVGCETRNLFRVDPQQTEIWLKGNLTISQAYLQRKQPSALFVFAKMSSEVFLNGERLGNNGTPSYLKEQEFPGDMDASFYIPPRLIKQGLNEVIIHASSHQGLLSLSTPIHFIGISEYSPTSEFFKQDLLISLSLLGAMLLGCTYLVTLAFRAEKKSIILLMLSMLMLASAQLLVEISRVMFNYSYPMHDIRLIAIVVLSLAFGFSFLLFSIKKFARSYQKLWLAIVIPSTLVLSIMLPGFDGKSAIAILVPALFSAILSGYSCWKERTRESLSYLIAYILFSLTIIFTFLDFHSMLFYYIVTGMMAFLVIRVANEFIQERSLRKAEAQQVLKLQLRLDQLVQQESPTKLQLNSAGKVEFIPVDEIAYCKAAGDYVEIMLTNSRQSLFSGTLKSIEKMLPSTFLKVHRSYIVNLDQVVSIASPQKGAASSGVMVISSGDEIPVSRRILPHVRRVIKGNVTPV